MTDVLVIGGGVAGTAAALAAAGAHARVTLLDGGTGASTLATGALDVVPWQRGTTTPAAHSGDGAPARSSLVRTILGALGAYSLPDGGARLATTAGIVRPAAGHDAALLNVAPLGTSRVGVIRCERPGWDADALAAAWGESFVAVDATVLRHVDERVLPDADFAARCDDDERFGWLAERLRASLASAPFPLGGLMLPPSLGVEQVRAPQLALRVGVPCGEPIAAPGGPSGLRFEHARNRALTAAGVVSWRSRAASVARHGARWRATLETGDAVYADAVVLATGGLLAGGIEYDPSEAVLASALPPFARVPFRLGLAIEGTTATLGVHGRALELPGSLFGVPPESLTWPFERDAPIERVGLLVGAEGSVAPGFYVAGDVVADMARTWLQALESGAEAGVAASRGLGAETAARSAAATATDARPPSRP
jgi:glycine/D-amino acid oxidase-like deaminating enzyme